MALLDGKSYTTNDLFFLLSFFFFPDSEFNWMVRVTQVFQFDQTIKKRIRRHCVVSHVNIIINIIVWGGGHFSKFLNSNCALPLIQSFEFDTPTSCSCLYFKHQHSNATLAVYTNIHWRIYLTSINGNNIII